MTDITSNLHRIDEEKQALRGGNTCTVVAVSKKHPVSTIQQAIDAGHRIFGENRVQEAQEKWLNLKAACPDIRLHLIGSLQRNKAKDAIALFDVIETLDRPSLAEEFTKLRDAGQKLPDLLIQLNIGEEDQKGGILPQEADDFIQYCIKTLALPVKGLMCLPPAEKEPSPYFALLAKYAHSHNLSVVSMGMSSDWQIAVPLGATHVRIGTGVFGERPY